MSACLSAFVGDLAYGAAKILDTTRDDIALEIFLVALDEWLGITYAIGPNLARYRDVPWSIG